MFDIMLVDDDEILLYGLMETVDWQGMDCNIVAQCTDVNEGLEKFLELRPQIVITDICMSGGNGFELIEKIQNVDANVQFIMLTGYAEFDYAKNAIEKNVVAFLLKPTNVDEVIAAVKKAKSNISRMTIKHDASNNDELREILEGKGNIINFLTGSEAIPATLRNNYTVAAMKIDDNGENSDGPLGMEILEKITDYNISVDKHYILHCRMDKSTVALVIFLKEQQNSTSCYNVLSSIQRRFLRATERNLIVGVSGAYNDIEKLPEAWRTAKSVAETETVYKDDIIEHKGKDGNSNKYIPLSHESMNEIIMHIKRMDRAAAVAVINKYFDSIENNKYPDIENVRNDIEELGILIIHSCIKNHNEEKEVFGRVLKPVVEVERIESVSDIKLWITDVINKIIDTPQMMIAMVNKSVVRDAILYIMKHYSEPLMVDSVAEILFVSARHLSRQFKLEVGKTFVEYLTDYRIQIAEELLRTSSKKVYEIGESVGYKSLNYFCKVFKENTGMTPLDYRNGVDV